MKGKRILIILIGFFLLLLSGAGAVYFFATEMIPGSIRFLDEEERAEAEKGADQEKRKDSNKLASRHIYTMDPIIVNLADKERIRYLKIRINLESRESKPNEEYEKRLPQLRDLILTILSAKNHKDIADSEGKKKLREEITARINEKLTQFQIQTVYFTEFVLQ